MDNDIEVEKEKKSDARNENVSGENSGFGQTESPRSENAEIETDASRKNSDEENSNEKIAQDENSSDEQDDSDLEARSELLKNDENLPALIPDTESEVMLFLADELEPLRRTKRVNVYDLETEYAKTRKNKLWSVWIMLTLTFCVIVLVTVFTVRGLSASNEKIDVSFSSFKDLDLQNLFDQLQRTQEKFEDATKRSAELRGQLESRLSRAAMKRDNDLNLLKNTRLSRSVVARRTKEIQDNYNRELAAVHSEFDADLKAAEAEVKQYEEQLKSYDSENVARAQKWEQEMDSERQLHQLEKQRLVQTYEDMLEKSRVELQETRRKEFEERRAATTEITNQYEAEIALYDPIIRDVKILGIVSDAGKLDVGEKYRFEQVVDSTANLSESFVDALEKTEEIYGNLDTLYKQSASIPNRNTMRSVVSAERKLSVELANNLTRAAVSEIADASQKLHEVEVQRDAAQTEIADVSQKLRETEEQRAALESILNGDIVDEKTAGFVIALQGKYGFPVFIRDAVLPQVTRDGSTRIDIFSGRTKISSGFMIFAEGKYFIALDNEANNEKIAVGNTFRISSKK